MSVVKYFNFYYFMYPTLAAGLFALLYFILRKCSKKAVYWTLFGMLAFNLALHFAKLAFTPYRQDLPYTVRKITFENICAVSTMLFPFFYVSKNNTARDYMYYLGVLSGVLASFVPTEALGKFPFAFDVIRFYVCHSLLWIVPLLMVLLGEHKLDYRRILRAPTMFLCVECLILVNEVIVMATGLAEGSLELLLSPDYRNSSFIFGVTQQFMPVAGPVLALVPRFLKVHPITGEPMFWPVLWMVIPVYVYFTAIFFLMALPFEHRHVRADLQTAKLKLHRRGVK